jgi:hypothetical protein
MIYITVYGWEGTDPQFPFTRRNQMAAVELFDQVARQQKRRIAKLIGSSSRARLQWLLKFTSIRDFDRMSAWKFERIKRQIIAFADFTASSFEVETNQMSRDAVRRISESARNGMRAFVDRVSWDLPRMNIAPSVIPDADRLAFSGAWNDVFLLSVSSLLPASRGILRVCAGSDCDTLFAKRKRKIFCSPRCSDRERMRRFQADRKRYKDKRRKYYLNSLKRRER